MAMSIDVDAGTDLGAQGDGPTGERGQRLGGLTAFAWDRLAGRNFYSTADWLGFCAADFGGDSSAAVSYRDGEPVCAVPYVRTSESLFSSYRWHDLLTAAGLPAPAAGGVLVGPREGYQTHFLGAARATPAELADVVAQARAAAGGESCVAMYVATDDVHALRRAGIATTPVLLKPDAWIELPGSNWAGWEASLSKNRRKMVRRDVRQFRDGGYRIEQVPLPQCWHLLGELASATQAKYGHATAPEVELTSLRNHAVSMGDAARTALLYAPDGALAGFCLYYLWQGTVFLRWLGLDYDRLAGGDREYFSLCYYAQIECAEQLGIERVHAGVDSVDAKAFRGARVRPLWLLDLTEDSALAGADAAIRRHNASHFEVLKADPVTATAVDDDAWLPFL
jgi:uncharacterized protein